MSKIESKNCKISDGRKYNIEAVQNDENKQFIEKILKYKVISLENYKKALDEQTIRISTEKLKKFYKLNVNQSND